MVGKLVQFITGFNHDECVGVGIWRRSEVLLNTVQCSFCKEVRPAWEEVEWSGTWTAKREKSVFRPFGPFQEWKEMVL